MLFVLISLFSFITSVTLPNYRKSHIVVTSGLIAVLLSFVRLPDSLEYQYMYEQLPNLSINIILGNSFEFNNLYGEYLFKLFMSLTKTLGLDYQIFTILCLFIIVSLKLFLFSTLTKKNHLYSLAVLFYFSFLFYQDSYILRQSLASSLVCLSIIFLLKDRIKKGLSCWLVSPFIHTSSAITILIFPIEYIKLTKNSYYILLIIFVSIGLAGAGNILNILPNYFPDNYISQKIAYYANNKYSEELGLLRGSVILYTTITLLSLTNKDRITHLDYLIKLALTSLFFLISFNDFGIFSDRIFRLFSFVYPVLYAFLLVNIQIKNKRYLYASLIFLSILLSFYSNSSYRYEWIDF